MSNIVYPSPCLRFEYTGNYKISDLVTRENVPGPYKVFCLSLPSLKVAAVTTSAEDGTYTIDKIKPGSYMLIARDHSTEPANAAIADNVVAELMT